MNEIYQPVCVQEHIDTLTRDHLLPVLKKTLQDQVDFIMAVQHTVEALHECAMQTWPQDQGALLEAMRSHSRQLLTLLEGYYHQTNGHSFSELFSDYLIGLNEFAGSLSTTCSEIQKEDRFKRLENDNWRIRLYKYTKRRIRATSQLPVQMKNGVRKILKKEPLTYRAWTHQVPLRNLTLYHYYPVLSESLLPILQENYRIVSATSLKVWQITDKIYSEMYVAIESLQTHAEAQEVLLSGEYLTESKAIFRSTYDNISEAIKRTESGMQDLLTEIHMLFGYHYDRVGTVELKKERFSHHAVKRKIYRTDQLSLQCRQGWLHTLFVLHDDWRLDEEYNELCDNLRIMHDQVKNEAERKIRQLVLPKIENADNRIQQALEAVSESGRAVKKSLTEQLNFVDQQLIRTLIPSTMTSLYNQDLTGLLDRLQTDTASCVEEVSEKRGLISDHAFDKPVKASDINYISPRQIVSFEILPVLQQAIYEIKEKVSYEIALVQKLINELGQISYFNLESALSVYEDESDQVQKPREIAEEGLSRALKNADRIKEQLAQICHYFQEDVRQAVDEFNHRILDLKDNNYVFEIKLRIAKAKTLERTRALKKKTYTYLKNAAPRSLDLMKNSFSKGNQMISEYQKRIGIEVGAVTVSTEISDFLNDTETAIGKLPYVYQRLFSVRPLEDTVFYEERVAEMAVLQEAFQNWEKGRYASTILLGEKGSGITTINNIFLKNFAGKTRYQLIYGDTIQKIYTEKDFIAYMNRLLPESDASKLEDIIVYLQQQKKKTIFVFENLEHFYLRKVNGFQCLKMLFELISKTQKQVFWLCSCTMYAWYFLDKTSRISSYFEYTIKIDHVQSQQLKEVILKRHRVSGYGVMFTPSLQEAGRKKFQKMSDQEQQVYLENEYFQDLNQVTSGNFSIAQLFWLRSTRQVTGDVITIGSLKDIDFSFLKSLPLSQVLALHALLLHDGLTEPQYMEVAEQLSVAGEEELETRKSSLSLIQMQDDGLLTRKEKIFLINPLLYRQVVNLLQVKNFLH